MSPSVEAQRFFDQLLRSKNVAAKVFDLEKERLNANALGRLTEAPNDVQRSEVFVSGVRTLHLVPANAQPNRQLIFIHGGAFGLMSPESHERFAGHVALACQAETFIPDYSLAPEFPFPKALEETKTVVSSLVEKTQKTILLGESAGGSLALGCIQELKRAGQPLPDSLILLCPWLDLSLSGSSVVDNKDKDVMLTSQILEIFVQYYLGNGGIDASNARVSPLFGDLNDLPATYCQAAENDILLDDAIRLSKKKALCTENIELEVFSNMCHGFQFFVGQFPEAKRAINKIGAFVSAQLAD